MLPFFTYDFRYFRVGKLGVVSRYLGLVMLAVKDES